MENSLLVAGIANVDREDTITDVYDIGGACKSKKPHQQYKPIKTYQPIK